MTDEIDAASDYEQSERDRQIAKAHAAATAEIPLEYECRTCGDSTNGARWCSKSCCEDYERRVKQGMNV